MVDVCQVTLPDGTIANFKDSHARSQINSFLTGADAQTIYGGVDNMINSYIVHPMTSQAYSQITPMSNVVYTVVEDNGNVKMYLGNVLMAQGYQGETNRSFGMMTRVDNSVKKSIIMPNEVIQND